MSVAIPVIDYLDLATKHIYLLTGVREYHPVDDIYKEIRNIRRTSEAERKYDIPVKAFGAVPKGGGKFTPRYAVFYDGWTIVPEDVSHSLYISGEQLTEAGESGPACLDLTVLSAGTNVIVHYEPPAAELIKAEAEIAAINRMKFNERVTIDIVNGTAGTDDPIGSPANPVNNIQDAVTIANKAGNGFDTLFFIGGATFSLGDNVDGFNLIGQNAGKSTFTIEDGASCIGCEIEEAYVTGILDGGTIIRNCIIGDLTYVNGVIHQCMLNPGTITLGGNSTGHFLDCYSGVPGISTPTIDMGGTGNSLAMRGYKGGIELINKSGPESASIDLDSGQIILDSTITGGVVVCRGVGKLTDNTSNGATIYSEDLLNSNQIAIAVLEEGLAEHDTPGTVGAAFVASSYVGNTVHINTASGVSGTTWPAGTASQPVNNLADALQIMSDYTLEIIHLDSDLTVALGEDVSNFIINGAAHKWTLTFATGSLGAFTTLENILVTGDLGGCESTTLLDCVITNTTNVKNIIARECFLAGTISMWDDLTANTLFIECTTHTGAPATFNIGQGTVKFPQWRGKIIIDNKTGATTGCNINSLAGPVTINSSCVAGSINVSGICVLTDNSGPSCNVITLYQQQVITAAEIWNTILTGATYNEPTSAGRRLRALSTSVILEGIAVSATINTVVLDADASAVDGAYDPAVISIVNGTGSGQSRLILQYEGTTKTVIIDRDWKITPDATSEYTITADPGREHINEGRLQGATINTLTLNANASDLDDAYNGQVVFLRSGPGQDQACKIVDYDGTTKIATLCKDLGELPDNTTGYVMLPTAYFSVKRMTEKMIEYGLASQVTVDDILDHTNGRWKIDTTTNQMIFYKADNITEIARYNLYDENGVLAHQTPYERRKV